MARTTPPTAEQLTAIGFTVDDYAPLAGMRIDHRRALAFLADSLETANQWWTPLRIPNAPRDQRTTARKLADALAALYSAGLTADRIDDILDDDFLYSIVDLLSLGVSARDIDSVVDDLMLNACAEAINRGLTIDQLRLMAMGGPWEDVDLDRINRALDAGLPTDILARYENDADAVLDLITLVEDEGIHTKNDSRPSRHLSWDDVRWMLANGLDPGHLGLLAAFLTEIIGRGTIDRTYLTPQRLKALASLGATSYEYQSELLALLAVGEGHPWLETATVLARESEQPLWEDILTARRLENDPTLPGADTRTHDWTLPTALSTPVTTRRIATLKDMPASEAALVSSRDKSIDVEHVKTWMNLGIGATDAIELAAWLSTEGAISLNRGGDVSWLTHAIPTTHTIAVALANGVQVSEIRHLAGAYYGRSPLGPRKAALTLACGIPLATAEAWVRTGTDPEHIAILTAYGADPALITTLTRDYQAENAIWLLASGAPLDDLPTLLPTLAGIDPSDLTSELLTAPLPLNILTQLAHTGHSLADLLDDEDGSWERAITSPGYPGQALVLATHLAHAVNPNAISENASIDLLLALGSAAVGDPASEAAILASKPGRRAAYITIMSQLARAITDARQQAARTPTAHDSTTAPDAPTRRRVSLTPRTPAAGPAIDQRTHA